MPFLGRAIKQPQFVTGAVILMLMVVGMRAAARTAGAWLEKRPVPIRKPLRQMDRNRITGFRFVEDRGFGQAKFVETDEYLEWRLVPTERFKETQIAYLGVYFYTGSGKGLQIPHTPEVCYRQSGNQVTDMGKLEIPTPDLAPEIKSITATYVRMSHPTEVANKDICVAYVFCVNGKFFESREKARIQVGLPWNRAVYLAKIDCTVRVPAPHRLDAAIGACRLMLSQAIPELVREHFPRAVDIDAALAETAAESGARLGTSSASTAMGEPQTRQGHRGDDKRRDQQGAVGLSLGKRNAFDGQALPPHKVHEAGPLGKHGAGRGGAS